MYGGATVEAAAGIFTQVLQGNGTAAQHEVVLANATLALRTITGKTHGECREQAERSLFDGKAFHTLEKLTNKN